MRRPVFSAWFLVPAFLALNMAAARPVAIGGALTSPRIETKTLPSGQEGLPVWFLPRLGVETLNGAGEVRLRYAGRELRFTGGGWNGANLPAPELLGGSVHVPLAVLRALGLPLLADAPEVLDFAAPGQPGASPQVTAPAAPAPTAPAGVVPTPAPPVPVPSPVPTPAVPAPTPPVAASQLTIVRSSRALNRAQETQRLVLEFSAPAPFVLSQDKRGLTLRIEGAALSPAVLPGPAALPGAPTVHKFESGDTLSLSPAVGSLLARLETGEGGASQVFTLEDPYRIVIDTVTNLDARVPPPPDLGHLPPGVAYRQFGKLQLLSFDPALFTPKVVTAGVGTAVGVSELVRRVGGVAGVNGGYFDPASSFPVDLVAQGGLMLSPSLERRATLGFTDGDSILFGFPRPRYTLSGDWGALTVNTVRPQAGAGWVTLFVGDGRTPVGAPGFVTLTLDGAAVAASRVGMGVPGAGEITVTFDPARFPQLPTLPGQPLQLLLNWAAPGWAGVREALSAGPLLVENGQYALDASREGFNVSGSIWRPTRQVAFAIYQGWPTIAYFNNGTPEEFARALVSVHAQRAMRLDSGSSATVFVAGGYFNTVWSRPVPNAIVFVPKVPVVLGGGK